MSIKKAYDKDGNFVDFNTKYFTFKLNGKKRLTSCTKFIKQFFPEFDKETVSKKYAEKHGMTQQEVLDMWNAKAEASRKIGDAVHLYAESILKGWEIPKPEDEKQEQYFQSVDAALLELEKVFEFVEAEKIVFDAEKNTAGIMDLLMQGKNTGILYPIDWKSNEQIKKDNPFQSGFEPITHLEDCNYVHYSLQLQMLSEMLKNDKIYEDQKIIPQLIHIKPGAPNFMKILDVSDELKNMHETIKLEKAA